MGPEQNLLNTRQKKYLRGLGHHLSPSVIVGREGITDSLLDSCRDSIQAHELVKIKLGQNSPLPKKDAADRLARGTGSHLIQLIGKTVLLYRPNPSLPPDDIIQLPE